LLINATGKYWQRTLDGETKIPRLCGSLETRTWPKADRSRAEAVLCCALLPSPLRRNSCCCGLAPVSINKDLNAACFHGTLVTIKSIAGKTHHLAGSAARLSLGYYNT